MVIIGLAIKEIDGALQRTLHHTLKMQNLGGVGRRHFVTSKQVIKLEINTLLFDIVIGVNNTITFIPLF